MPTFLVTGATGAQGGATARYLLAQGATVHALTRDTTTPAAAAIASAGAILHRGDLSDAASVTAAAQGVDGAFLNPFNLGDNEAATNACRTFVDAIAKVESCKILVLSTTFGTAGHAARYTEDPEYPMAEYYAMKSAIEDAAREKFGGKEGRTLTILRPPWLLQNYLPPRLGHVFPDLVKDGGQGRKLITALKSDVAPGVLDSDDVGRFAAAALLDPGRFAGEELDLVAEYLTAAETARIMGEVAGVKVEAPEPKFDGEVAVGVTGRQVGFWQWANRYCGDESVNADQLEKHFGIRPVGFKECLEKNRQAFTKEMGI